MTSNDRISSNGITRREFIHMLGAGIAAIVSGSWLAACVPTPTVAPPAPLPTSNPNALVSPGRTAAILRAPETADYESFAKQTERVFKEAYATNGSSVWDERAQIGVQNHLNTAFFDWFKVIPNAPIQFNQNDPPLVRTIQDRIGQIYSQKMPVVGDRLPGPNDYWRVVLRAIKDEYKSRGYAVAVNQYTIPPTIEIYKDPQKESVNAPVLNLFDDQNNPYVQAATINMVSSKNAILDTPQFLELPRAAEYAYPYDGDMEVFIREEEVEREILILQTVAEGGIFTGDFDYMNSSDNKAALSIRKRAQAILEPLAKSGSLRDLYINLLKIHGLTHLLPLNPRSNDTYENTVSAETRSNIASLQFHDPDHQLYRNIPYLFNGYNERIPQLALATYLITLSRKDLVQFVGAKGKQSPNAYLAGMQKAMEEIVRLIGRRNDLGMILNVEEGMIPARERDGRSQQDQFIPRPSWSNEFNQFALINLYQILLNNQLDFSSLVQEVIIDHAGELIPNGYNPVRF